VISGTTVKGRLIATQRMLLKLAEGNVDLLVEVARETVARGAKKANIGTFKTILADRLEQRKKGTPPPLRLVADKGRPAAAPPAPAPDPNDLWGINGFCAAWAQAGKLRPSSNRLYGEWVYGRGFNFDAIAKDVAKAARLHVTWRGSWEPLAGWLDRGCTAHDIKAGIAKAVASDPSPTQSLRRFDKFIAASKAA
jgi:hypothetical protein